MRVFRLNESNDPHRSPLFWDCAINFSLRLAQEHFSFSWPTFIIIRKRPLHIISPTFFNNFFILCLLTKKKCVIVLTDDDGKKTVSRQGETVCQICDLNYYWPFRLDFIDTLFIYLYFGSALEDISIIAQNPFFQFNCVK